MHDPKLQESQFKANEETPGQTGAPSEQKKEHVELDLVLIGTVVGRMDKTATQ
jgi:hypothetical protein